MSSDHAQTEMVKTKLARRWLIKMTIITVAFLAFGGWALVDLVYVYPKRGVAFASVKQLEYLRATDSARTLFDASISEPSVSLELLSDRNSLTEVERAELEWLEALAVPGLGMLKPEHTQMESPRETLMDLEEHFASAQRPKALTSYDLPVQAIIMVFCWGIAAYLLLLWVRVMSKRYTWVASEQRLGLPGGATLVPADLADLDKRKWHKFLVTLEIKGDHPKLGGKHVALDLYRYLPLEEWVLEMEKAAFPDRQEDDADSDSESGELAKDVSVSPDDATEQATD